MDSVLFKSYFPELFLSIAIFLQVLYTIQIVNSLKYNFPLLDLEFITQIVFIGCSLLIIFLKIKILGFFSNFVFINDNSSRIIKIILTVFFITILDSLYCSFKIQKINFFEFLTTLMLSLLSMYLLISSCDLISFYLSIEMQSICFYILSSCKKNSSFSIESGLKYFISGSFMSAIFLIGSSVLYGCVGTLNLNNLSLLFFEPLSLLSLQFNYAVYFGFVCVTSTLLFKIVCAPFHFWAPDVYEGSPLFSTIIFSVLPKIAIIYFLIKWINCFNNILFNFKATIFYIGLFSCFWGAVFAFKQLRIKRLVIYSSIAQVGFILCSLSLLNIESFSKSLFFTIIYTLTSIIIWSFLVICYYNLNRLLNTCNESLLITHFSGLFDYNKNMSLVVLLVFFSLGGIPPLTGFLSKALILVEIIYSSQILPAVFILLISSFSMFYYLRVLKIVFFEPKFYDKVSSFNVVFKSNLISNIYFLLSILLITLLLIFIFPNELYFLSLYVFLNSVFF